MRKFSHVYKVLILVKDHNLENIIKEKLNKIELIKNKIDEDYTIGALSTLEYMVESTLGFENKDKAEAKDQINSLEKFIYRWRSINGDGNCFYRSVMFSYLENIIFENNIYLFKSIIVEIFEMFDLQYDNNDYLPIEIKQKLSAIKSNSVMFRLLYMIYELIDKSDYNKSAKTSAYEILIKAFNHSKDFDLAMIMYFRYKLYQYIKNNKDKSYNNNFSVKLGNLLPAEYETNSGGKSLLIKTSYSQIFLGMICYVFTRKLRR